MTRVKICGITNLDDALYAAECGADALGFILVSESPRYVRDDEELLSRISALPPFIVRVAVCRTAHELRPSESDTFDAVQFYNDDWHRPCLPPLRYIRAVRVSDISSINVPSPENRRAAPDALLLDAYHPAKLGGSGETFDWDIAVTVKRDTRLPLILAGGLTPENVGEAVRRVRPYAVDVSSGVEKSPGQKDRKKIKAFLEAVREADSDQPG